MTRIALYLARARNGVIGKGNAIPWRLPGDLPRFKAMTMGKPVIMGRKTWDSLPRRPLPGRVNLVVTRNAAFAADGAVVARSVEEALTLAGAAEEVAVIGGAEIYRQFLPRATHIYLTEIDADIEGDTYLPPFDRSVWREAAREAHVAPEGLAYAYVTLVRSS